MKTRCPWAGSDPLYHRYHDEEWGVPVHDDRKLFEMLVLEGAQAGLSWITVLRKRENYRKAFDRFDVKKVATYDAKKLRALLADPGLIRNRLKLASAIHNAQVFLQVQKEFGGFHRFLWSFVNGKPIQNAWKTIATIPPRCPESDALSRALKQRGLKFVGSTICYAMMQSIGMVNDHLTSCFRYHPVKRLYKI